MAWKMYRLKNPHAAWNMLDGDEWVGGLEFVVETDVGQVIVEMDKPGRVFSLGIAGVAKVDDSNPYERGRRYTDDDINNGRFPDTVFQAWCFDRRIVAMVADFLMKHGWDGGEGEPYPERGEEIYLPIAEEADAIYAKYDIPTPQTSQECDRLYCECVEVGNDGKPLDPNAELD